MKLNKTLFLATAIIAAASSVALNEKTADASTVATTNKGNIATLYTDKGKAISNRALAPDTQWGVGKIITVDGEDLYQVSTSEYLKASEASITGQEPTTSAATQSDSQAYTPDINQINKYFGEYLNALHQANGTGSVQVSANNIIYAGQRAGQQNGNNLDHSTATKNMSECLSGAGYDYIINKANAKSDKQVAYFLLKQWYDEDNNIDAPGTAGHYGHRASLIYAGPNFGLGINAKNSAFEADWNVDTLVAQKALYNYTGSDPQTNFISEDAI